MMHEVGRVKEAHGLKGDLFVRLYAKKADWLDRFSQGYLTSPDSDEIQQFEVIKAQPHKDGIILNVGHNDRTPAEKLKGYILQISSNELMSQVGESIFLNEIIGFELYDLSSQIKTIVEDVSSNGAQDLLVVKIDKKEFLVPFVKPLIDSIDFEKKCIQMNLPLGLFDTL